ncbi:phosphate ABC transporter permease PstA [Litorimonas sp. RW-G-Af-16]|uniref:phosphate ABC transporter permease PstA n=1 Tax=Litorimonas sp. RW-G-Af-16 TaxID=3241168 RepID=UPI00390C61C7
MVDLMDAAAAAATPNTTGKTDVTAPSVHMSDFAKKRLKKRYKKEWRFRMWGRAAICFALAALGWLLFSLAGTGFSAFQQNFITLEVELSESVLDPQSLRDPEQLRGANFRKIVQDTMYAQFPDVTERKAKQQLFALVSASGATNHLRQMVYKNPDLVGQTITVTVPASDQVDQLLKGYIKRDTPEARRKVTDQQIAWVDQLKEQKIIRKKFNIILFTNPDSRDPELAGIASAVIGSVMIVLIAFLLALPIGVGAAIYLDEFAPKNKFTDFIEININNLAAVPSIVFGLLGLAIFINFFGMQRSIPLVGGLVLALRAFPTIVIATRASLRSVSPAMVDGALSLGASHTQAVFHQKLPLAGPGILTGSIIAMAQVLGETAPLLMIGMVAFVTEIPNSVTDPATALPVQIFLWSDSAERAWSERTAAAIIVLLVILVTMNALAIWLRNRLEKRR